MRVKSHTEKMLEKIVYWNKNKDLLPHERVFTKEEIRLTELTTERHRAHMTPEQRHRWDERDAEMRQFYKAKEADCKGYIDG